MEPQGGHIAANDSALAAVPVATGNTAQGRSNRSAKRRSSRLAIASLP